MTEAIDHTARSQRTAILVQRLHAVVDELEQLHPGRKFTPDGHLVGSLGEAAAEAMFNITLVPASTAGHDAVDSEGTNVEIKATYGGKAVLIRPTSEHAAARLIVLRLSKVPKISHEVVYNGPLVSALAVSGPIQSNGQSRMSLAKLRSINAGVSAEDRVKRRSLR